MLMNCLHVQYLSDLCVSVKSTCYDLCVVCPQSTDTPRTAQRRSATNLSTVSSCILCCVVSYYNFCNPPFVPQWIVITDQRIG